MNKQVSKSNYGKPKNMKKSVGFIVQYLKKHVLGLIIAIIIAIIGSALSVLGPFLLQNITKFFDEGALASVVQENLEYIFKYGIFLIVVYLISVLFSYLSGFIMTGITQNISREIRRDISSKINDLPLKYFDSSSFGDVLSRITNDVDIISQNLNQIIIQTIEAIIMLIGITTMMFVIEWKVALMVLVTVPISMFLMAFIIKRSQKYFRAQQSLLGDVNGYIEESFSGHIVIKAYNQEEENFKHFAVYNNKLETSAWKSQFLSSLVMPLMFFIGNLSYTFVCCFGAIFGLGGSGIIAFIQYSRRFNMPIQQIGQISSILQMCAAASERVGEFIEEPSMPEEHPEITINKSDVEGYVNFDNVLFGYDPDRLIIKNFTCQVNPGQKVAIVGPTGAGKTTIVNLLMRFYDVDSGDIQIDHISTKDISRENTASLFGMVLQDTWLFEGTIMENLKYGNPHATEEEVINACKACRVHHFIKTLPGGYNYVLDENSNISGGQKQLLTIARAMIENAPMLILDEATSNVDTRTEILIQEAMDRLMEGRTTFVIAHRLSTIKNADIILVMKDGNIIEQGSHKDLMEHQGFYTDLYNSQFGL